jgi:hypothetical protein
MPKDQSSRKFSFVDPKFDVFFLKDYWLFPRSAIDTMVRWLDEYALRNLKKLAVFHHTWKEPVLMENLVALREFTGLKVLYVVFSQEYERGGLI